MSACRVSFSPVPAWVAFIATVGGAGLLKPAPGTWGSAAGLLMAIPLAYVGGGIALAAGFAVVTLAGILAAERYASQAGNPDPSEVVIDEVAGLWLALLFARPVLLDWALAFAAFRFFDIVKPWPISWADRRIKGGLGIMLDDLLAGALAGAALLLLRAALSL